MPMACVLFSQAGACPRSPRWRLTSYLSSPAAATLHGKTQGFVLRLPPQHKSHARFMQCSHYNAICNLRFNKRIELRTNEQPHVAEHHGRTNHTWKRTVRTRRTHELPVIPAAATLHGKTQGFVLRLPPQHKSHARFMQCSHYNAICNLRFNKRIELRTNEQPHVAEHHGRTNHTWKRTVRTRCTHELPVIAGCSHFTRQNTRFRAPASSPTQVPRKMHAAITMRFATCDSTSE